MFWSRKRKRKKHELELVRQYEEGRILQVNNGKDNKKHFEDISNEGVNNSIVEEEIVVKNNLEPPEIEPADTKLPEIKSQIQDLLIVGRRYLINKDIENATEVYSELRKIYNPEIDKELYPEILKYYNEILGKGSNE